MVSLTEIEKLAAKLFHRWALWLSKILVDALNKENSVNIDVTIVDPHYCCWAQGRLRHRTAPHSNVKTGINIFPVAASKYIRRHRELFCLSTTPQQVS